MRQFLIDLVSLLEQQKAALKILLDLSDQERRILVEGKSHLLEDIIRRELKELSKINALEKKRKAMHEDLALAFGLDEEEITISAIAERSDEDERQVIVALQQELTELLRHHTELNKENRELIKAHLDYTDMMLQTAAPHEDPLNNFYGGDGKTAQGGKRNTGFFDGQA
jgi:flagellar biosynthesis/type III secretory pathway chaperone